MLHIDIHTHNKAPLNKNSCSIVNILLPNEKPGDSGYYSVGYHPWNIKSIHLANLKKEITRELTHKNVIAIGECGLDRAVQVPWDIQLKAFELQLEIAGETKKPTIIHCVRAYSDVLQVLKRSKHKWPVIFHDYRGNKQQTTQLLNYNCFFSFGESLFKLENIQNNLLNIPVDNLFFETDESTKSIQKIYLRAAEILKVDPEDLIRQIELNFSKIF